MLSHGERLPLTVFTPIPPYTHSGSHAHNTDNNRHTGRTPPPCRICVPSRIPPTIVTVDRSPTTTEYDGPVGKEIPGAPEGEVIPGGQPATGRDIGPVPPEKIEKTHVVRRISLGHIEPAMLMRRVEPVYPPIPLQLHREGRVELRAIIATDGTIQSLEVVSGDPLFYASALAAVREWHYRATVLDGQTVEVDTHISVIYSLNH